MDAQKGNTLQLNENEKLTHTSHVPAYMGRMEQRALIDDLFCLTYLPCKFPLCYCSKPSSVNLPKQNASPQQLKEYQRNARQLIGSKDDPATLPLRETYSKGKPTPGRPLHGFRRQLKTKCKTLRLDFYAPIKNPFSEGMISRSEK